MLPEGACPKVTTLGLKQVNDSVNLESDLIGKYVERLLQERGQLPKPTISIDTDYLQKRGLILSRSASSNDDNRCSRNLQSDHDLSL